MVTKLDESSKKSRLSWVKSLAKRMLLGVALFHGTTQLAYLGNDIYNSLAPSQQRQEFKQEFGFPVKGWKKDVENGKENLSTIADVIEKERKEMNFELDSVRVRGKGYIKQNFIDQIDAIIFNPVSGYYSENGISKTIVLDNYVKGDTLHHEIKHAKTFCIAEKHPEFLEKWQALATDENGKSLYLTGREQACSRLRGLGSLINKEKQISFKNEKLGFISNYARTNVWEDIAELCAEAETDSCKLAKLLYSDEKNPKIIAKVNLAQEYGIIPKEFSEYLRVKDLFQKSWLDEFSYDTEKLEVFLRESEQFIKKYPSAIYECEIRTDRGFAIRNKRAKSEKEGARKAIHEYKLSLNSHYKDAVSYIGAMNGLARCYQTLGNRKKASVCKDAEAEYWKRFKSGDIKLTIKGVNDFLIAHGENLGEK